MKIFYLFALMNVLGLLCFFPMRTEAFETQIARSDDNLVGPSTATDLNGSLEGESAGGSGTPEYTEATEQFQQLGSQDQIIAEERGRLARETAQAIEKEKERLERLRQESNPDVIPQLVYSEPQAEPETFAVQPVSEPSPEPTSSSVASSSQTKPKKLVAKKLELEQVSFSCGQDGSTPSTIAKIKDQDKVVVILWSSTVFAEAGYDPQTRCKQVSERFEKYQKAKALIYVTAGKINGQPVLCVTSKEEGVCGEGIQVDTEGGLLYTLKPGSDAKAILEKLATAIKSQDKASQKPLKE